MNKAVCAIVAALLSLASATDAAAYWQEAAATQASVEDGQAGPVVEPVGALDGGGLLVDRDFGVQTSAAGLDRLVEMYQWRIRDGEYERVWNAARIDSTGFDGERRNPPFQLESRRWWSEQATLDGHPVDPQVLQVLGEWRVFRPNFTRLPLNMAAAFQPEGDGLGSAENPLQPQIGDLRIRWRELVLPPLRGKVALRDGVWHLRPSVMPGIERGGTDDEALASAAGDGQGDVSPLSWWWLAVPLLLIVLLLKRRKTRRKS